MILPPVPSQYSRLLLGIILGFVIGTVLYQSQRREISVPLKGDLTSACDTLPEGAPCTEVGVPGHCIAGTCLPDGCGPNDCGGVCAPPTVCGKAPPSISCACIFPTTPQCTPANPQGCSSVSSSSLSCIPEGGVIAVCSSGCTDRCCSGLVPTDVQYGNSTTGLGFCRPPTSSSASSANFCCNASTYTCYQSSSSVSSACIVKGDVGCRSNTDCCNGATTMFCDFRANSSSSTGYCNDRPSSSSSSISTSLPPPPPICKQVGETCTDNVENCCNSQCEGGICRCSGLGNICASEHDCCKVFGDEGSVGIPECTLQPNGTGKVCQLNSCAPFFTPCGSDCCNNSTERCDLNDDIPTSWACEEKELNRCSLLGFACNSVNDCCPLEGRSVNCINNVCIDDGGQGGGGGFF